MNYLRIITIYTIIKFNLKIIIFTFGKKNILKE